MVVENVWTDYIPDIVCFGVDCLVCGVLYQVYSKTRDLIDAINGAPKIDLDETNLKLFFERNSAASLLTENGSKIFPYVAITGKVTPEKKSNLLVSNTFISSQQPNVKGVIKETSIVEHKTTLSRLGFWYDSSRTIHSYTNDVPFWLIPLSKSGLSDSKSNVVEVREWNRASRLDLEVVSDHFEPSASTLGDHIFGFVAGDRPKGIQTVERMLCEGTSITAVGQLVMSQQGKISILRPDNGLDYLLVKNGVKTLLEDLSTERRILRTFLFVFGGVGVFIAGFATYRYWKKEKERRLVEENFNILQQIREERGDRQNSVGAEIPQQQQCVVCLGNAKEVIFFDCGHVCACTDCTRSIMTSNPICPICRADIVRVARAFIS